MASEKEKRDSDSPVADVHVEQVQARSTPEHSGDATENETITYRTYKRRWFGLIQLVLMNIIVSWDWLTYSPVPILSAQFFNTSEANIAWLATAFLFAFSVTAPATYWSLQKHGPKASIMVAAGLLLVGNWIRYGGTRVSPPSLAAVGVGQALIGFAQPFVLAVPTSYSDMWFTPRGRVSATAFASLANGFGGALGQLINPFLATQPSDIAPMTLYVSIISTVICIPSFFVPARPPTPVAASSTHVRPPFREQVRLLSNNLNFWLIFIAFVVYCGIFNSFSSLIVQMLTPYGYSEQDGGIAGAILILVGLVCAAVSSPLIDRSQRYVTLLKCMVPLLGAAYLVFYWAPPLRNVAVPYVLCAVIGASSFSILPVVLECITEITWPVAPGLTSALSWAVSQLVGAILIIVSEALVDGKDGDPPGNMHRALILQSVLAMAAIPVVVLVNWVRPIDRKRLAIDRPDMAGVHA